MKLGCNLTGDTKSLMFNPLIQRLSSFTLGRIFLKTLWKVFRNSHKEMFFTKNITT